MNEPTRERVVVPFDDETRRESRAEADRQYRVQNSVRKAAWSAFFAAFIYAGIAAYQTFEMRKTTKAAQESATAAAQSVDLARKQMEGISAADVEFTNDGDIYVAFTAPPNGEIRTNFVNNGHVIAHNTHFVISLSIHGVGRNAGERKIFSKSETIPILLPMPVANRPDFIFPFELSRGELQEVLNTNAYLVVEGSFDYENGFDKTIGPQQFCRAYVWGPQFGRWMGACTDVEMKIREARIASR